MDFAAAHRRLAPWFYSSALAALLSGCASTEGGLVNGSTRNQVIISIRDQKLTVIQPDHHRVTFPISTSKFGFGDRRGSYATPLGELEVAQKIGGGAPAGSVFRSRIRTGEIVGIDAPGRDAIVTRILALRGLESGNRDAYARGIYIHGTPEERNIGRPSSYGCIRMRSKDVIALYDMIRVGAKVQIIDTTVNKALAENIVPAPPPTPPPVVAPPVAVPAPTADVAANTASGTAKTDPATAKALAAAVSTERKATPTSAAAAATEAGSPPEAGPLLVAASPQKPAAPATQKVAATAPQKPAAPAKKEWAGSPTKLLAKANEAEAKTKNTKTIGAAHTNPSSSNGPTETSYSTNGRDLNRGMLDSL